MITVLDILTDAYTEAFASPEYKTGNIIGLKHLHLIVQDVWSHTIKIKKANSNWDIWLADTVSLQDEYTKPLVSSDAVGAQFIESVSVAYNSSIYKDTGTLKYIPCRYAMDYQINDWDKYIQEQSNLDPIYYERDGSVFIAPDPRSNEVGVGRIKIKGIRSIASGTWTTATNETTMKLPIAMMDILKLGLVWKIYAWHTRDKNAIISSKNEFIQARDDAIATMFTETPFINEFPR